MKQLIKTNRVISMLEIHGSFFKPDNSIVFRDRYDYGPFPVLYFFHYLVGDRAVKYYGTKISYHLNSSLGYLFNGRSRYIMGLKNEWRRFVSSIFDKVIKRAKFVTTTNRKARKVKLNFEKFIKIHNQQPDTINDIIQIHKRWLDLYMEFSFWNIPLWLSIPEKLTEYLKSILQSKHGVTDDEFQILTTPCEPSYVFKEELELLKCARDINFIKNKFREQDKNIIRKLTAHSKKWFWVPFDYLGPDIWGPEACFKRIRKIADTKEKIGRLLVSKINYYKELKKTQIAIVKKNKIGVSVVRLLKDLRAVMAMQDEKKEICTKAQYFLQSQIFSAIGKKLKIDPKVCIKFSHTELWKALKENKIDKSEIEKRKTAVLGVLDRHGYSVVGGERAKVFFEKFSPIVAPIREIKGQVASRGVVIGRVKILLSPKQIFKIEKGDILVVTMTTPDYIPAMKKAAAIVTSEGGISCHAAIVSRELKIPCIIGTKIAHVVLKDGDLVEVDANIGAVKVLGDK